MAAPPPDAPSVADQDAATTAGGFAPAAVPAASLCGFKVKLPNFLGLVPKIPGLGALKSFLPPLPVMPIAFNCTLDNPISVPAKPWGGGRSSVSPHDPDTDYDDLAPGS